MSYDPFAPAAGPTSPAPHRDSPQVPCTRCGRPLDPASVLYSDEGTVICAACNSVADIDKSEGRAANNVRGAAVGALLSALTSACFNPFFLLTFLALSSGIGALIALLRDPLYKRRLGGQYGPTLGAAIGGVVIGAGVGALQLLGLSLLLQNRG